MSDVAIQVRNLSKQYRLGERQGSYKTLRDTLTDAALSPVRRVSGLLGRGPGRKRRQRETVWALKDVSFDVRAGEVVGVIGRNGAGKSTLLKILSRITEPTSGYADINGRVGSLLEVGTGFHPELTGRENIYLNGAILGMRRAEIAANFDAIVAFAEVEKFIDTPVKFYSSGMYMRLAFAVAAHLEPEILLVDEVLAVGDVAFQKKCLGRMRTVAREGKTVLLVSHNMAVIHSLADSVLLLAGGQVQSHGSVSEAILEYHRTTSTDASAPASAQRAGAFFLRSPKNGCWDSAKPTELEFDVTVPPDAAAAQLWCIVRDQMSNLLLQAGGGYSSNCNPEGGPRIWNMKIQMPALHLRPGMYNLQLRVFLHGLGKRHYFSDPFALEVASDAEASLSDAMLTPPVNWIVSERECEPSAAAVGAQS